MAGFRSRERISLTREKEMQEVTKPFVFFLFKESKRKDFSLYTPRIRRDILFVTSSINAVRK
jgi:hypothetical protein